MVVRVGSSIRRAGPQERHGVVRLDLWNPVRSISVIAQPIAGADDAEITVSCGRHVPKVVEWEILIWVCFPQKGTGVVRVQLRGSTNVGIENCVCVGTNGISSLLKTGLCEHHRAQEERQEDECTGEAGHMMRSMQQK